MNEIGVTGYKGRLGSALVEAGLEPCEADITDPKSVREHASKFSTIINCAAYTDVDGAESNYDKALKINTQGVRVLRSWFVGRIIHISTDYVFSGESGPYTEKYKIRVPVNCYGYSKLGGELAMLEGRVRGDTVVRTTGLYGTNKKAHTDLAEIAFSTLQGGNAFNAVVDLFANQTYIPHLVEALVILANNGDLEIPLIHIASMDICSRYAFVRMIAERMGVPADNVIPTKASEIGTWKAARPVNGGLKCWKARGLGLPIYEIKDGLDEWFKKV